jgi:type IV pilus assembly protein PilV
VPRPLAAQQGASLIEVLIAVLILGVGMLGIAAMQATALRNGQSSLERSQAVIQTYTILDVLRANRTNAIAGYYNTAGSGPQCSAAVVDTSAPSGQQSAQGDLNQWLSSLKQTVGTASDTTTCGRVSCVTNTLSGGTCTVVVQWDDSRGSSSNTNGVADEKAEGGTQRQVTTVVAI